MQFIIYSKKHGAHKVLIDDEDEERVLRYTWHVTYCYRHGRAFLKNVQTDIIKNNKKTGLLLHRLLIPNTCMIDHVDGNPLNNQKSNLRACLNSENAKNVGKYTNNTSGFKGVSWHRRVKKFYAQIGNNGQKIYLGYFAKKEDAARAYNEAAKRLHGEFARLNVI